MFEKDKKINGYIIPPFKKDQRTPARIFFDSSTNNLRLEVLENIDANYGGGLLKGVFQENYSNDKIYISFINFMKQPDQTEINFNSYIVYNDFLSVKDDISKDPIFIDFESKTNNISLDIKNLDKWVWNWWNARKTFEQRYLDNEHKQVNKQEAYYIALKMLQQKNDYCFKFNEINITISLNSDFNCHPANYPKIICEPYVNIDISTQREQKVELFIEIIEKLNDLLSLLFGKISIIENIYEFKKLDYRIEYCLYENQANNKLRYASSVFNIDFADIQADFSNLLQKWFDNYENFRFIIHSIYEQEAPIYIEDSFTKHVQLIETFGNILSKGRNGTNTRADILTSFNYIDDDLFKKIFFLDKDVDYDLSRRFFEHRPTEKNEKEYITNQLMNIRNFFTHPYFNGKPATTEEYFISKDFLWGHSLCQDKLKVILQRLKIFVTVLLLKQLDLESYYKISVY